MHMTTIASFYAIGESSVIAKLVPSKKAKDKMEHEQHKIMISKMEQTVAEKDQEIQLLKMQVAKQRHDIGDNCPQSLTH